MAGKKKFVDEFKTFVMRGNVMDLAVGLIIGSAFTAIVKSLVNDIVMPIIGMVMGGVNFTALKIVIRKAALDRRNSRSPMKLHPAIIDSCSSPSWFMIVTLSQHAARKPRHCSRRSRGRGGRALPRTGHPA